MILLANSSRRRRKTNKARRMDLRVWDRLKPCDHPYQINADGGEHMLHLGLRLSPIAGVPEATRSCALGDRTFDPCPPCGVFPECRAALALPCHQHGLIVWAVTHR